MRWPQRARAGVVSFAPDPGLPTGTQLWGTPTWSHHSLRHTDFLSIPLPAYVNVPVEYKLTVFGLLFKGMFLNDMILRPKSAAVKYFWGVEGESRMRKQSYCPSIYENISASNSVYKVSDPWDVLQHSFIHLAAVFLSSSYMIGVIEHPLWTLHVLFTYLLIYLWLIFLPTSEIIEWLNLERTSWKSHRAQKPYWKVCVCVAFKKNNISYLSGVVSFLATKAKREIHALFTFY